MGKIMFKIHILFKGYLNLKKEMKKSLDKDGRLNNGDITMNLPENDNAFRIIDKVKKMFKLHQGEYIAPEKIEHKLFKCKYIELIFIYGIHYKVIWSQYLSKNLEMLLNF